MLDEFVSYLKKFADKTIHSPIEIYVICHRAAFEIEQLLAENKSLKQRLDGLDVS